MFPGNQRPNYPPPQGGQQYGGNDGYNRPNAPPPNQSYGGNNQGPWNAPQGPPGGYAQPPPGPPPGQGGSYNGYDLNSQQFQQQQQRYQQQQSMQQNQHLSQNGQYSAPNSSYDSNGNYHQTNQQLQVPTAPQSFGNNSGMTFQYSNCTGQKKALLVGINYFGSKNELRGCVNDVKNMSLFLNQYYGYSYDNMVMLTDDQQDYQRIPTRQNIINAMQWLVRDARPNDSYFFHISSHGGLVPDQDGDEEDGFDSCIYPVDFERAGPIIDDEMHDIMVKALPPGCKLTALFDCCHSGTALDLPFVYSTKGVVKEPNLWKDAGSGALQAFVDYERGNIGGAISAVSGIFKKVTKSNTGNRDKIIQSKMSPADVVSLSGCKDDQTSADATEAGKNTGAMSWAFISVLSQNSSQSYLSLLNNMRSLLSAKYSQKPQLSASHPQDMNIAFIL